MNRLPRIELALRALTTTFLVVAAVALLLPPAAPMRELPPDPPVAPPAGTPPHGPAGTAAGQTIIAANIFSPTRSAPAARYHPFEPDPDTDPVMFDEDMMADPGPASNEPAVPHLYGTVVGPAGASALMRLDAAVPGARLYREGDRAGTYRILKIHEQSVVLDGPEGRIVLRLTRSEGTPP